MDSTASMMMGELLIKPVYYGWYSHAIQQLRVNNPSAHMYRERAIQKPPYSYYYTPDKRKVLVTEITHSSIPTERQIKNGDIFLGEVTTCCERSYDHREARKAAAEAVSAASVATALAAAYKTTGSFAFYNKRPAVALACAVTTDSDDSDDDFSELDSGLGSCGE